MTDDEIPDTAIALALKRAAGEKLRKRKATRAEREAAKQRRLDKVKSKAPAEARPPRPMPAPQTAAPLQVSAQQHLQDKAARERRIRELTAISLGRAVATVVAPPERPPPSPPTGPDDPRIRNGTLAPSPKVAAMLRSTVSEAATAASAPRPRVERSGYPAEYLETLRSGTPEAILAGRLAKDLKGTDLDAFNRARKRELDAVLAGRRFNELSRDERKAYMLVKARHLKLILDPTLPRARRKGAARGRVGTIIDRLRHEARLTIKQVAEQAEVPAYRLAHIVAGKRPAKEADAKRLGNLFNVNPETFMTTTNTAAASPPEPRRSAVNGITPPKTNPNRPGYNETTDIARLAALTEPRSSDTAFQATLRRIMRERGLMAQHVAKVCDLSLDVPGRLLRVGSVPSPATRRKLVAGLGMSEELLFGKPAPKATKPAPEAPPAAVAVPRLAQPQEAPVSDFVGPTVAVEMGVPMPPIVLRSDRYPWAMPKGGSFKADAPFGMSWGTFRSRFVKMLDRQSEILGHWYTFEENEPDGSIRVWRVI